MTIAPKYYTQHLVNQQPTLALGQCLRLPRLSRSHTRSGVIILCAVLLLSTALTSRVLSSSAKASMTTGYACNWYTVGAGDTLSTIASQYHTTISALASVNAITNTNLIFVGQSLCVPYQYAQNTVARGILADGTVRWYDYDALDWSNRSQVRTLIYQVAANHQLPVKLVLAIAWQESGWTQHVIAWDGGIGVMQLMPYTAQAINAGTGIRRDPYRLWDNLNLGATYLQWLWQDFHGNLPQVISGYNEGGWAVAHQGIFNWSYVNNVTALMRTLS